MILKNNCTGENQGKNCCKFCSVYISIQDVQMEIPVIIPHSFQYNGPSYFLCPETVHPAGRKEYFPNIWNYPPMEENSHSKKEVQVRKKSFSLKNHSLGFTLGGNLMSAKRNVMFLNIILCNIYHFLKTSP